MHEIKCPQCGATFTIDEDSYADILSQVRSDAFKADLAEQTKLLKASYQKQLAAAERNHQQDLQSAQTESQNQVELLKKDFTNRLQSALAAKDRTIASLQSSLDQAATAQKLAVSEATGRLEREHSEATQKLEREHSAATQKLERENAEKVSQLERANANLQKDLENARSQSESKELILKQSYEQQLHDREDTIARLQDLKSKLSTKMVGETLEQHCQNEFNSIRATAFPRAQFGKDNTVSAQSGSKGDFIFRDFDENGTEIVSIMFEMKNENDTTATKHKNEHFFKELDKDRREKGCEYAVLVSLLEADSDLYNQGIVDVSYAYPKMYVIRPQCFIPLISIIVNTAKNALAYKTELARVKNQNLDITNFETKLNDFKASFALNSDRATANFKKAIDEIDKSIKSLENTKQFLERTAKNFGAANNKLDDLTIKRLTRGNATMTKMFADLNSAANAPGTSNRPSSSHDPDGPNGSHHSDRSDNSDAPGDSDGPHRSGTTDVPDASDLAS